MFSLISNVLDVRRQISVQYYTTYPSGLQWHAHDRAAIVL